MFVPKGKVYKKDGEDVKVVHIAETTTQKQRDFLEPIGNKHVTKLPGIGETLGMRLTAAGYVKATQVLGQYLVLDMDEKRFKAWMKDICNASSKHSTDVCKCLNAWCEAFL